VVVGRAEIGEFVELPRIGAAAIRLLDEGTPSWCACACW
jgi:hypothetical protein